MQPSETEHEIVTGDATRDVDSNSTVEVQNRPEAPVTSTTTTASPQSNDAANQRPLSQSFFHASAALEDALALLRQVRSTLRQLDERGLILSRDALSTSPPAVTPLTREDGIAPPHSAIVLSDNVRSQEEAAAALSTHIEALTNSLPPSLRTLVEQTQRQTDPPPMNRAPPGNGNVSAVPTSTAPASFSYTATILPAPREDLAVRSPALRTPRMSTGQARPPINVPPWTFRSRINNPDDASTTLGRRVAARAASSPNPAHANTRTNVNATTEENTTIVGGRVNRDIASAAFASLISSGNQSDNSRSDSSFETRHGIWPTFRFATQSTDYDSDETVSRDWSPRSGFHFFPDYSREDARRTISAIIHQRERERRSHFLPPLNREERMRRESTGNESSSTSLPEDDRNYMLARTESTVRERRSDTSDNRRYRIRRRVDADGEEVIHHIDMSGWWGPPSNDTWPSAPRSTSFSAGQAPTESLRRAMLTLEELERARQGGLGNVPNNQQNRTQNRGATGHGDTQRNVLSPEDIAVRRAMANFRFSELATSNLDSSGAIRTDVEQPGIQRRRGWARLDADGEEISTDEEEEIERHLAARRVRGTDSYTLRREYLNPPPAGDFSSIPFAFDDDHTTHGSRVRCFGVSFSEDEGAAESFDTAEEYYVNPLPLPLEDEMVVTKPIVPKRTVSGTVSRKSQLAAR